MIDPYPSAFSKHPHAKGCTGSLINASELVFVDRTGRVDNGGIVTHAYRCNRQWQGCKARVLVTERAARVLAVAVEVRK